MHADLLNRTINMDQVSRVQRFWLFLQRQDMRLMRLGIKHLRHINLTSKASVIGNRGPVVSLTTFGPRLEAVYLTIESIAAGSLLPSRLILWLQDVETYNRRPDTLRRLETRGLEVRLTRSYGSHSKYYPYLLSLDKFTSPLVTADDDVLYSRWWLKGLAEAHAQNPELVNCYRARVIHLGDGFVRSYFDWTDCLTTQPSVRHLATGVAGCIYPAPLLESLKNAGDGFMDICPKADDVWLHVNALRAGFEVRQITRQQVEFPVIPGTQENGLFQENIWLGRNDEQIKKTYTADDIRRLNGHESHTREQVVLPAR